MQPESSRRGPAQSAVDRVRPNLSVWGSRGRYMRDLLFFGISRGCWQAQSLPGRTRGRARTPSHSHSQTAPAAESAAVVATRQATVARFYPLAPGDRRCRVSSGRPCDCYATATADANRCQVVYPPIQSPHQARAVALSLRLAVRYTGRFNWPRSRRSQPIGARLTNTQPAQPTALTCALACAGNGVTVANRVVGL